MIVDPEVHEVEVKRKEPRLSDIRHDTIQGNPATAGGVTAESICNAAMDILGAR